MLSLYKLDIFSQVVQAGSFSKAASRLLMTQSGVSQHINDLEKQLNVQLFDRGPRGVTLTEHGKRLHDYAVRLLDLAAKAENALTDVNQLPDGVISIVATPGINVYLLPEWLSTFQRRYTNLTVALQTDITPNIITDVAEGRVDLGIVEGELAEQPASLGVYILQSIDLFVIIGQGHHCWHRDKAPADALDGQAFVARQNGSQTRTWFETILAQHNIQPRIVAEFDNQESIKHAVANNMGITILPAYAVQREVEMGILRAVPIENVPLQRHIKLIWNRNRRFTPLTHAFIRNLDDHVPGVRSVLRA